MNKQLETALRLYEMMRDKQNKIDEIFGVNDSLGYEIDEVMNLICTIADIPEDNTVEMGDKYGDINLFSHPDVYCRDWVYSDLDDFYDKKISFKKIINLLTKQNN